MEFERGISECNDNERSSLNDDDGDGGAGAGGCGGCEQASRHYV